MSYRIVVYFIKKMLSYMTIAYEYMQVTYLDNCRRFDLLN